MKISNRTYKAILNRRAELTIKKYGSLQGVVYDLQAIHDHLVRRANEGLEEVSKTIEVERMYGFLSKLKHVSYCFNDFIDGIGISVPKLNSLLGDRVINDYIESELVIDEKNIDLLALTLQSVKVSELINEPEFHLFVTLAHYRMNNLDLPKLDFSGEIDEVKKYINKRERELIESCKVKVGELDFDKLKLAIDDQIESEMGRFIFDECTIEELEEIQIKFEKAVETIYTYDPKNTDLDEVSFYHDWIKETFEWLGKSPSEFLINPKPLAEVDLTEVIESGAVGENLFEVVSNLEDPSKRTAIEFEIDCWLTLYSTLDKLA
jgi:hypothetical protein